ncbi:hypothetical protein [Polyangium jinanense]|uniref:Uncharacterized protein n=1 Tax=Polyangium jinanense TaxID=2829994 RepID=A0A9X3X9B4_9BACT|nr:hypothetical protein [Polyangium jinanense]MDC3960696.1 hypothetical protein [Polyangium jinanense]MDC3984528.1 hypothetical protein [Polyangium jinanense]
MNALRDVDDDAATTVMDCSALPPQSGTRMSLAHSEPPRDTIMDTKCGPSRWDRFWAFLGRKADSFLNAFREPPLSTLLPPVPPNRLPRETRVSAGTMLGDDRWEFLLIELLRAPPHYQRAAREVVKYAVGLRQLGEEAYIDGLVHLVLSRQREDADGTISIGRLRDILRDMSFSDSLMPALRRLDDEGTIDLLPANGDVDRNTPSELRAPPTRIRLWARV